MINMSSKDRLVYNPVANKMVREAKLPERSLKRGLRKRLYRKREKGRVKRFDIIEAKCAKCGCDTLWDSSLGDVPFCVECWYKEVEAGEVWISREFLPEFGDEVIRKGSPEWLEHRRAYRELHVEEFRAWGRNWYWLHRKEKAVYMRKWREDNLEILKAYNRAWYRLNSEKLKAMSRDYYHSHKIERKAYSSAYYESHQEEIKARGRVYRESHREELRDKQREYYQKNRLKILEKSRLRYLVAETKGDLSPVGTARTERSEGV